MSLRLAALVLLPGWAFAAPAPDSAGTAQTRLSVDRRVTVEMFGARGDGKANDRAAFNAAFARLVALGGGTVELTRGRSYWVRGPLDVGSGVRLDGNGARLVGEPHFIVAPGVEDVEFRDMEAVTTTGNFYNIMFRIHGANVRMLNTSWGKWPVGRGTIGWLEESSRNVTIDGFKAYGSHGIFVAGKGHRITNWHIRSGHLDGMADPPDDGWVIKADGASSEDIVIARGLAEGFFSAVSIGGEVGLHAEDDPTYSVAVRNILISDIEARDCLSLVWIKPGVLRSVADESADWRYGLVENIRVENGSLVSKDIVHGVRIEAGRGAIVRNIQVSNIRITGRAMPPTGLRSALAIRLWNLPPDALIEKVFVKGLSYTDSHAGAPLGTPGTVNHPMEYGVYIEREMARGAGDVGQVEIEDLTVNGTRRAGFYVGPKLSGPFRLKEARLTNVSNAAPNVPWGGVFASSRLAIEDLKVALSPRAPPRARPIGGTTAAAHFEGSRKTVFVGDSARNSNALATFVAPVDAYVYRIEVVASGPVPRSDTGYRTLRATNGSTGGVLATVTTRATGGVALSPGRPVSMSGARPLVGDHAFLPKGGTLSLAALKSGSGVAINGLRFIVHYVPYGEQ